LLYFLEVTSLLSRKTIFQKKKGKKRKQLKKAAWQKSQKETE